ncbi:hypothetical protein [Planctobacterium marinum]|uniref:Uncharacterized protein n=1 Tax=Planctobacterium marinum TaxID=1631968 RepID=A0AA48HSA5_9ALTE|nr:hypothetical protein MACH26_33180 [Planctobacterium marinum]
MNNIPFFSDNEPEQIRENSLEIQGILAAEELDAERLQIAVESRERLILKFLESEKTPEKSLLRDLNKTNQELTQLVNKMRSEQQGVLVGFLRNRKAVKKYKK